MASLPRPPPDLLQLARRLSRGLSGLRTLDGAGHADPREAARLLLETKLVPELETSLSLPIFVGVQGGTNTGKSTVFNALAGKLLSPTVVLASATKHPLVYAHARWRKDFIERRLFPGVDSRELEDPRELLADAGRTDLLYFRFHDDARTERLALIDSPDFDGALESNALQASWIAAISDVTLFVTTAQKYRDRVLVERLRSLLAQKARTIVVLNLVDEQVVFETILDDLRSLLPAEHREVRALRVPTSAARHPEEEIATVLDAQVMAPLRELRGDDVKPAVLRGAFESALGLVREALAGYESAAALKAQLLDFVRDRAGAAASEYARRNHLSFPEETVVMRRFIGLTEIGSALFLSPELERSSTLLRAIGSSWRRCNAAARRVLVRLARHDEGSVEPTEGALQQYAQNRDRGDADVVLRLIERLRVEAEAMVREKEEASALARRLARELFTPAFVTGFAGTVAAVHARRLAADGRSEQTWVASAEAWIQAHPWKVRAISAGGIAVKVALGVAAVASLPPAIGFLGFLSPWKWIEFAAGYLIGAYLVSLVICFVLRRRARFLARRRKALRETMEEAFVEPVRSLLDAWVPEGTLREVREIVAEIEDRQAGDRRWSVGDLPLSG